MSQTEGGGDSLYRKEPKVLNTGITIVGKRAKISPGTRICRNCVIYGGVDKDDFPGYEIQSGETIKPKRRRKAIT